MDQSVTCHCQKKKNTPTNKLILNLGAEYYSFICSRVNSVFLAQLIKVKGLFKQRIFKRQNMKNIGLELHET